VPFKFQSFNAEAMSGLGGAGEGQGAAEGGDGGGLHLRARTVAVHFVNTEDGSSAGVLHIEVRPSAMTVARTFRFHAAEHDFHKARLPPPPGVPTRDAHGRALGCSPNPSPHSKRHLVLPTRDAHGQIRGCSPHHSLNSNSISFATFDSQFM
jgi:hypothetical protein